MRKQIKMSMASDDDVTISFHDNYGVTIAHSDVNRGKYHHKFEDFDSGRKFFLEMIGALCLDGYCVITR